MHQRIGLGMRVAGCSILLFLAIRGHPPAYAGQLSGDIEHAVEVGRATTLKDVQQDGRLDTLEKALNAHLAESEKHVDHRDTQMADVLSRLQRLENFGQATVWAMGLLNAGGLIMTLRRKKDA